MRVYAVFADNVLIAQFDHPTDAVDFQLLYSSQLLPMTVSAQQEDYTRTVYPNLPNDVFCRELIAYKTGVRLK